MNVSSALQMLTLALALLCAALVPVAIRRDPGLARRAVTMNDLPRSRWPNLLTRAGTACLLASFVVLLAACYYLLASPH